MRRTIFAPEHEDFRAAVRGFLKKEAVPRGEEWEASGMVDRAFWRKAAAQGYVGFTAPEELGGAGVDDFRFNAIIDEEVAYTGTVGDNFQLVNDILTPYLLELTSEEQRRRWVPGVTTGDVVPAIAMSEPGTGSDLRAIASTATWDGDHWKLSGSKTFVTSGIQADLVIVAARIRRDGMKGMGLFVVEDGAEGFTRGRKLDKIGRRAQDTAELFFEDVVVTPENVLGETDRGLQMLMRNLPQERLAMAVTAVASSERALEITLEYVRTRNAFGQPVGSFQANRHRLATAATEVAVARIYVDRCILAQAEGELTADEAAAAKFWTTELQFKVIDLGLQMHGGYGYMEEYEIARMWRDARVQRIYGGTTEIMKEIVGRSLGL
ncbi:MAG TPA: acyl-CoA dehydrogenase family protein [Baekduia sp.]|uniref:acyl-CoA dehydrogenase family protein n=1 Tax=Baekduia sp. TaxID=2600305 RepID=UPI002D79B8CB|nr:acyl-CoA dehydrogenase family protein [Baekduia sp.]HET6507013.1 acyl-CoA dehydrogenase family protein [Baekduia sp.]